MTNDPVKQSLGELQWLVRCRCDPAYTSRNLRDPDCNCDNAEAVKIVTDRIEAQAAEIERLKAALQTAVQVVEEAGRRRGEAEAELARLIQKQGGGDA